MPDCRAREVGEPADKADKVTRFQLIGTYKMLVIVFNPRK